jgi:hypothetical protein
VHAEERPALRRRVDRLLHEMLVKDAWGLGARVICVEGTVTERAAQVLRRLQHLSPPV